MTRGEGGRLADGAFMDLWPEGAPGALGAAPEDRPALRVFLPEEPSAHGASMIVCPGGGYQMLAEHESAPVGKWLAKHGITAFVLRYRLAPKYHYPCQFDDVRRAVRYVRANAEKWKLNPDLIGMLGFSAGGHLTSIAATYFDAGDSASKDPIERVSSRLTVQVLIYSLIALGTREHMRAEENLLGPKPSPEMIERFSTQKHISAQTPPAFLVHSNRDTRVPPEHSDWYVQALRDAGIPYEYMLDDFGEHGCGLIDAWTVPCLRWLKCWLIDNG